MWFASNTLCFAVRCKTLFCKDLWNAKPSFATCKCKYKCRCKYKKGKTRVTIFTLKVLHLSFVCNIKQNYKKSAPDGYLDRAGNRTFHATKWWAEMRKICDPHLSWRNRSTRALILIVLIAKLCFARAKRGECATYIEQSETSE